MHQVCLIKLNSNFVLNIFLITTTKYYSICYHQETVFLTECLKKNVNKLFFFNSF